MGEVVIFCEAYPHIKDALYVATHECHDCLITIVTIGKRDLLEFFKMVNEELFSNTINIVYFETYQGGRVKGSKIKRVFHVLPDIIRERRYLNVIYNKYFAGLRGARVFFLAGILVLMLFIY